MSKPEVPQKSPYVMELEPGTYYWCACGRSEKQPFCDGSHKGTDFRPKKLEVSEKKRFALCGCKHTQKDCLCDGSHKNLD
ncbi:MAG: CDGSH iron-sulfur domain-containing protein [Planctomycetota bacterium]|nr:MAG: CDGSH iron-sulfur domain-containing protein [Planctomycetota bacterium]